MIPQNQLMKTEMNTSTAIENLFEEVEKAIIDYGFAGLRGEHAQHWHALRVTPDGSTYTSEEASPSYSEGEYYHRSPHTLTIHSMYGDCWSPSPEDNPGWAEKDDGSLDLGDWCGDAPSADEIVVGWREKLQAWIDAGNFTPSTSDE